MAMLSVPWMPETTAFPDEASGIRLRPAAPPAPKPIGFETILSESEAADLRRFFRESEGEALATNAPPSIDGRDSKYGCDGPLASLIDSGAVAKARWVRERLLRMEARGQGRLVVVLHLLFGNRPAGTDPAPCAEESKAERARKLGPAPFRDLAAIVHLTDAVEDERHRLGGLLGAKRAERTDAAIAGAADAIAWAKEEIATLDAALTALSEETAPRLRGHQELPEEREFWATAGQLVALDARIDAETDDAERERLDERRYIRWTALERRLTAATDALAAAAKPLHDELRRRRAAWRRVIADTEAVRDLGDDAAGRATWTAYNAPTRELSAHDVLRAWEVYGGPSGDKDAFREWTVARNDFYVRVRNQAERLRADAHRAFAEARFA